ncbi:MAG: hypothetical protein PH343_09895, partial [Nitrospira sp.]|nr:hypothetical protein [Nitrospira sp.]
DRTKLLRRLKKIGFSFESYGYNELSPRNKLIHSEELWRNGNGLPLEAYEIIFREIRRVDKTHGEMLCNRLKKRVDRQKKTGYFNEKEIPQELMSALWKRYHNGAFNVAIKRVRGQDGLEEAMRYVMKYVAKDIFSEDGLKKVRPMISKGWRTKHWHKIHKLLVLEAMRNSVELGGKAWEIMHDKYRQWCNGEWIPIEVLSIRYYEAESWAFGEGKTRLYACWRTVMIEVSEFESHPKGQFD